MRVGNDMAEKGAERVQTSHLLMGINVTCTVEVVLMGVKNSFLFVKTIEKVIRLCTVLIFFMSGSFEDIDIFHVFQLSFDGGRGYIYT